MADSLPTVTGSARRSVPMPPPNTDPAYLRGRAEFQSVFGDLAKGKRNWQLVAFGAIGVAGVLAVGMVSLASQSRVVPYVVEVDRLGRAGAVGPAEQLRATDQRLIASQLAGFVRDIRSVIADGPAESALVRRSYAFVDQHAADFLNAYFANPANDPRLLARDGSRLVEIVSVLPLPMPNAATATAPTQTWKVSWTETTYSPGTGAQSTSSAWEGYFATRVTPPTTAEGIEVNPLGLYVTSINWTRLASRINDASARAQSVGDTTPDLTTIAGAGGVDSTSSRVARPAAPASPPARPRAKE